MSANIVAGTTRHKEETQAVSTLDTVQNSNGRGPIGVGSRPLCSTA